MLAHVPCTFYFRYKKIGISSSWDFDDSHKLGRSNLARTLKKILIDFVLCQVNQKWACRCLIMLTQSEPNLQIVC